jgi:hypothetical protein
MWIVISLIAVALTVTWIAVDSRRTRRKIDGKMELAREEYGSAPVYVSPLASGKVKEVETRVQKRVSEIIRIKAETEKIPIPDTAPDPYCLEQAEKMVEHPPSDDTKILNKCMEKADEIQRLARGESA